MYSSSNDREKLVSAKDMHADAETGSVLAQYVQQNGGSVCLPLGYSVYMICVNTELADDAFTEAEIAALMLNTGSTDTEAEDGQTTDGYGTDAPQPEPTADPAPTAETDGTEATPEPSPTPAQTLDLTPDGSIQTAAKGSTPAGILKCDKTNGANDSDGTAEQEASAASRLVSIMPEAYGALDYLYGEGAASRLYAAQERSFENALDAFAAGEAAYMITGSANYAEIMQKTNTDGMMSFKLMLLWLPDGKAYPVHAELCISERAAMDERKAESSAMFINALVGNDAQTRIFISVASATDGIMLPVNKEVRNEVLTKKYQSLFGGKPNAFDNVYFID